MERLVEKFRNKLNHTSLSFTRGLMEKINWNSRLIGIKGARGVGKTTLMLQYIKKNFAADQSVLYVSLDDIWFSDNKLSNLADRFVKQGGKHLFLDEVHKYPNWSREIKNLYDDYAELKIVFTGSSLLEILNASADLSRRAVVYKMQGLSFREYLNLEIGSDFSIYTLEDILKDQVKISDAVRSGVRPLQHFPKYLRDGYYPFFKEDPEQYHDWIGDIINMIIDTELPLLRGVDVSNCKTLKQILLIISESAPFIPNISLLSRRTGIDRNTIINYLKFLAEADLIRNIYSDSSGLTRLMKPEKIFLENTNIVYSLRSKQPEKSGLLETYLANQLSEKQYLTIHEGNGLLTETGFVFEIEKEKADLTKYKKNRFLVCDDIEFGGNNRIPAWLFGFLY